VDLVQRLQAHGVRYEELLIPDEIHDFLRFATWQKVGRATTEFLERELGSPGGESERAAEENDP